MKQLLQTLSFVFCTFFALHANAEKPNYLQACWKKQVKPLKNQYFSFHYQEKQHTLEHSFEPWEQTKYVCTGDIWVSNASFLKKDTMTNVARNKTYYSKTQLSANNLLFLDYGDKDLFPVTKSMFTNKIIETCRYSPIPLIHRFYTQKIPLDKESNADFAIYTTNINDTIVKLYIRKSDNLLAKITTLSDDALLGDVLSTLHCKEYMTFNKLSYPKLIAIDKINGKIADEVSIMTANLVKNPEPILKAPSDYKIKEDIVTKPDIKIETYSKNIHFIELKHTDDKVMIVEFEQFLLVAEAPLNSENGELILQEAKKIAPNKPVQYFVFGHYHPHYLGGMRPFIHEGAKIICSKADEAYVKYLANAPHSIKPDALHLRPKALVIDEIEGKKTITDGKFEMKIYHIGKKSRHTNDYLIYYFPQEKLLFQDDLVWIPKEGDIPKAGGRQAGLYNAIKELDLDVKTIIQSWPVADYGVKTVIPFEDMEKSMQPK